jgi:hypothetical protein
MAVRTQRMAAAMHLLDAANDATEEQIAAATSAVVPLIRATSRRDPHALEELRLGFELVDRRGTWLEVLRRVS